MTPRRRDDHEADGERRIVTAVLSYRDPKLRHGRASRDGQIDCKQSDRDCYNGVGEKGQTIYRALLGIDLAFGHRFSSTQPSRTVQVEGGTEDFGSATLR